MKEYLALPSAKGHRRRQHEQDDITAADFRATSAPVQVGDCMLRG